MSASDKMADPLEPNLGTRQTANSIRNGREDQSNRIQYIQPDLKAIEFEEAIKLISSPRPRDGIGIATMLNHFETELSSQPPSLAAGIKHGELFFIEDHIKLARISLDSMTAHHPDRAMFLEELREQLKKRYLITGSKSTLDESIKISRQIVDINADFLDAATNFIHLADQLATRYISTGDVADLDEATQFARQAVQITPPQHPDRAIHLNALGTILGHRFEKTLAVADLDEAIEILMEAIKATSDDDPSRAMYWNNIGILQERYSKFGKGEMIAHTEEAIRCYQSSLRQSNASAIHRIEAAMSLMSIAPSSDWNRMYESSSLAVNLLPLLERGPVDNCDKLRLLGRMCGLACDAAAAALHADQGPFCALNLLEQGLFVIASSFEEARSTVPSLQEKYPGLASRFLDLKDQLDQLLYEKVISWDEIRLSITNPNTNGHGIMRRQPEQPELPEHLVPFQDSFKRMVDMEFLTWEDVARRYSGHIDANPDDSPRNEFEQLLVEIRQRPGFEDFLLPKNQAGIQNAAKEGPIVVINVSKYGCSALLVETDQLRSLTLTGLSVEEIERKLEQGNLGSPSVLEWLWDTTMAPIMDALGFTKTPLVDDWPRVWWIPTGLLKHFPLHAAGYHSKFSAETVLDRVMSSYISSIKAITHGRQRQLQPSTSHKALLVAMEHTPNSSRLPFAKDEVSMLHKLSESLALDPIEPGQRKSDIMSHLWNCKIFHFAGHGYTDKTNTWKSQLLLEDWKDDPFTVADLLEMNLRDRSPFLAYLSACGTSQIKDSRSVDEGMNLINAYQLAGFRHVIGTLWEVNDELCVDMAKLTYEGLRDGGMTDKSVCQGLHQATRQLRDCWAGVYTSDKVEDSVVELSRPLGEKGKTSKGARCQGLGSVRIPRDATACDNEPEIAHWVPYVHYGI